MHMRNTHTQTSIQVSQHYRQTLKRLLFKSFLSCFCSDGIQWLHGKFCLSYLGYYSFSVYHWLCYVSVSAAAAAVTVATCHVLQLLWELYVTALHYGKEKENSLRSHRELTRTHWNLPKNSLRTHWELTKKTHWEITKNSLRIQQELTKNPLRIQQELTENSLRTDWGPVILEPLSLRCIFDAVFTLQRTGKPQFHEKIP